MCWHEKQMKCTVKITAILLGCSFFVCGSCLNLSFMCRCFLYECSIEDAQDRFPIMWDSEVNLELAGSHEADKTLGLGPANTHPSEITT